MLDLKPRRFPLVIMALVAIIAVAFAACDGDDDVTPPPGETPVDGETPPTGPLGSVDVLGIWGAEELESFEALVAPWQADTGGTMNFTGTRDITAQLTLRVEGGNPPDVAIPAETGLFRDFAQDGLLAPLSECAGLEEKIRAEYPQAFVDLGTVDGTLYGIIMKTSNKGTIWYNPQLFADNGWEPLTADASFADLVALTEEIRDSGVVPPWSIGIESGEASGWPGTDWIQQIILNEFGADVYDGIVDGSIPATSDEMRQAWEMFGEIAIPSENTVQGGAAGINATGFIESTHPPFDSPPQAAMVYLGAFAAGFITDQFADAQPEQDFDFFPFPGGGVTGDLNIVYAFRTDETVCSFLDWLASAEAQQIWVERGGFTSVNNNVPLDAYPDEVSRKAAQGLLEAPAFRHDLDDAVGGAWQSAFFTGVTQYIANPDQLEAILADIEAGR